MTYQPKWVRGEELSTGDRECASRYRLIADGLLGRFSRPVTMLDLGAAEGYFSFRAATDFDCVSIAIDGDPQLLPLCEANAPLPIIHLERRVSVRDLAELAACEHFDVVLVLNVLHHFPPDHCLDALAAVLSLGDHTVIETPPPDDSGACGQGAIPLLWDAVSKLPTRLLGSTPSHTSSVSRPIRLVSRPKTRLTQAYIGVPSSVPISPVEIHSTLTDKWVTFPSKGETREWIPGINLQTYLRMGGVYPSRDVVTQMVRDTAPPPTKHGDIRPWNMILDGRRLHLIDGRDARAIYDDREGLALVEKEVAGGVR